MTETWSDNRLSVPVYPDEDYNIPYNSPAANLSSQQSLDLALRANKVPRPQSLHHFTAEFRVRGTFHEQMFQFSDSWFFSLSTSVIMNGHTVLHTAQCSLCSYKHTRFTWFTHIHAKFNIYNNQPDGHVTKPPMAHETWWQCEGKTAFKRQKPRAHGHHTIFWWNMMIPSYCY